MYNLIERYINQLNEEKINTFAQNKGIILTTEEIIFTLEFIQKNWKQILGNHGEIDIERYKDKYSLENFPKIKRLYTEYITKYKNYL